MQHAQQQTQCREHACLCLLGQLWYSCQDRADAWTPGPRHQACLQPALPAGGWQVGTTAHVTSKIVKHCAAANLSEQAWIRGQTNTVDCHTAGSTQVTCGMHDTLCWLSEHLLDCVYMSIACAKLIHPHVQIDERIMAGAAQLQFSCAMHTCHSNRLAMYNVSPAQETGWPDVEHDFSTGLPSLNALLGEFVQADGLSENSRPGQAQKLGDIELHNGSEALTADMAEVMHHRMNQPQAKAGVAGNAKQMTASCGRCSSPEVSEGQSVMTRQASGTQHTSQVGKASCRCASQLYIMYCLSSVTNLH